MEVVWKNRPSHIALFKLNSRQPSTPSNQSIVWLTSLPARLANMFCFQNSLNFFHFSAFIAGNKIMETSKGNWTRNLIVSRFNYSTVTNWKINFDYHFFLGDKFMFSLLPLKWKIIGKFVPSRKRLFDLMENSISVNPASKRFCRLQDVSGTGTNIRRSHKWKLLSLQLSGVSAFSQNWIFFKWKWAFTSKRRFIINYFLIKFAPSDF